MMKASMRTVGPVFNTNRMVEQYTERFYQPSLLQWNWLTSDGMGELKQLARWRKEIADLWDSVRVMDVESESAAESRVGDEIPVRVRLQLGKIQPDDVVVELIHGKMDAMGNITDGEPVTLAHEPEHDGDGLCTFTGSVPCRRAGRNGFSVRVLPYRIGLNNPFDLGLVSWW
jgi:starch phosphorylase